MILAVDVGNTNIVLGCLDKDRTYFVERLSTNRQKTELEYAIDIKNVLEIYKINPDDLEGGIISSVVPQVTGILRRSLQKLLHGSVKVVGPGLKTGLNIQMDNPGQLGSDLVVGAVAAIAEYPVPLIFVDMGTATTIAAVDEHKNYIGGAILPGVRTSLDSLVARAAQLSQVSLEPPRRKIGKNTMECLRSGIIYGNAACLDGMIDRFEEELGQKATVIATGGMARVIVPQWRREIILDDDLLLKGLLVIYEKNRK